MIPTTGSSSMFPCIFILFSPTSLICYLHKHTFIHNACVVVYVQTNMVHLIWWWLKDLIVDLLLSLCLYFPCIWNNKSIKSNIFVVENLETCSMHVSFYLLLRVTVQYVCVNNLIYNLSPHFFLPSLSPHWYTKI